MGVCAGVTGGETNGAKWGPSNGPTSPRGVIRVGGDFGQGSPGSVSRALHRTKFIAKRHRVRAAVPPRTFHSTCSPPLPSAHPLPRSWFPADELFGHQARVCWGHHVALTCCCSVLPAVSGLRMDAKSDEF